MTVHCPWPGEGFAGTRIICLHDFAGFSASFLCGCCCSLVLNILSFTHFLITFCYNIEKELSFPNVKFQNNVCRKQCSGWVQFIISLEVLWCLLGRVKHWNVWTLLTIWVFYSVIKSFSELLPEDRNSRNFWYFGLLISLPERKQWLPLSPQCTELWSTVIIPFQRGRFVQSFSEYLLSICAQGNKEATLMEPCKFNPQPEEPGGDYPESGCS